MTPQLRDQSTSCSRSVAMQSPKHRVVVICATLDTSVGAAPLPCRHRRECPAFLPGRYWHVQVRGRPFIAATRPDNKRQHFKTHSIPASSTRSAEAHHSQP
ncbi:hypothetical protein E2C01_079595 [Portunus trituberculatus]|uniref:Uncharacterized protein n=1 Tax=Portunus trituberculatus TaxID=210409 RepID=A0A5B7IXF2_PORTR|nr:hypothetical protein [Portunus trituberculatus]